MSNGEKPRLSRRDFHRAAATAATLSLVSGWIPAAQDPPGAKEPPQAEPSAGDAETPTAEAAALAGIVRMRYGSRLDAEALGEITRSIDGGLKGATSLRKVPLENGEEPAFIFRAWRRDRD
jgi:hypothetical protein